MKKRILLPAIISISLALTAFSGASFAKDSPIGFVDTKKIFESSKLAEAVSSAEKELQSFKENLDKDTLNKSKQLEDAKAKKIGDAKLKEMQDKFQTEIENKRKEGLALREKKQKDLEDMSTKLKQEIDDIIKTVAKEKQVDVVVDKQLILFGGTDITEDVIKSLNKSK